MAETTASELLDVVDLNDAVVDSKTRGEVHRLQLPHRSIHVLVFNSDGRCLLQKRSLLKDECAGMWDSSCAGHVEAGQDYAATTVRELDEELGVKLVTEPEFLFRMEPNAGNGMEFAAVYRLSHDGPFVVAEDEIDELEWFSAVQLDRWVESAGVLKGASVLKRDSALGDSALKGVSTLKGDSALAGAVLTTGFCEIWRRYRAYDSQVQKP